MSLIGTLAVMYAIGFSLNTVSMLGMVLAIGLVVDDAIVVVENVERQLENGLAPLTAAKVAMSEVTGPIIATSAVLGAVFVPVAFLPGVTGRLYNQFALTIAISIAISAFNSLTLSPALCAVLLRHRAPSNFILFRKFNQGFDWASRSYGRGVRQLVKIRWALLALFAIGIAATGMLYCPAALRLPADRGPRLLLRGDPIAGRRIAAAHAMQMAKKVRDVIMANPAMDNIISLVGLNFLTGSTGSNSAAEFAILKPWEERGAGQSASEVMAALKTQLADIDAGVVVTFDPPAIPGIGQAGGFEFQLEDLTNHGPFALEEALKALIAEAKKQPEIDPSKVFTTYSTTTPQYKYDLDRPKTKLLGLNLPDVFNTLQIFFGSLYVNDFNLFGRTFRVTMQAEKDARSDPTDLNRLYVRNNVGKMVPLSTLGSLQRTIGPDIVPHYNLYNTAKINGTPAPGYSSGQAIAAMQRAGANVLPRDFGYEWTGITYQELKAGSVAVDCVLARTCVRVPVPCRPIRELGDAVHGDSRRALGAVRCVWHAVSAQYDDRRVLAGWLCHADRPCREERDPDRRVCASPPRGWAFGGRRRDGRRALALAAHPDDGLCLHLRGRPADAGKRRRRCKPPVDRHDGVRRHAGRDDTESRAGADLLRRHRTLA